MDTIVPFNDVVDCLRNPPSVHPCPDFAKLRALRLHLTKALKFFECPQSTLHGWSGLAMAPAVYALLEPVPFFVPTDPGAAPVYTPFATPAAIKMIDATFERDKNYFKSFKNIYCACFRMLDELVPNQFKVSNSPTLLGWNPTMSIELILPKWNHRTVNHQLRCYLLTTPCSKAPSQPMTCRRVYSTGWNNVRK